MNPSIEVVGLQHRYYRQTRKRSVWARILSNPLWSWSLGGTATALALFAMFMFNDSDVEIAFLLCLAWQVAFVGVGLAGGLSSLAGWFTFFPLFHFVLFALPLKASSGERIEDGLRVPEVTAMTMLLFYTALAIAGAVAHRWRWWRTPVCQAPQDQRFYTFFAWTCFIFGTLARLVSLFASQGATGGGDEAEGGIAGIANFLVFFENFSIGIYAYSVWKSDSPSLITRPTFWLFFLTGMFMGVLGSAKGATSEPLAYLIMASVCARGFKSKGLLFMMPLFVAALMVVYPIMHYARGLQGARTGSFFERLGVIGNVMTDYFTDSKARSNITESVDEYAEGQKNLYLSHSVGVFDRFIMLGNTDLLVAGVHAEQQRHGFHLFKMGLELAIPRFLYPNKETAGSGEELAEVAGTRNYAERTNPTWGIPGSLYFSFFLPGVFIGGFFIQLAFLALLHVVFGDGVRSSVWFPLLIVRLNGTNSCGSIDGFTFTMLYFVLFAYILFKLAKIASRTYVD